MPKFCVFLVNNKTELNSVGDSFKSIAQSTSFIENIKTIKSNKVIGSLHF